MKVLIVANNQKWKSWDKKIQDLKDWFKPAVKLDFDLIHTKIKDIPFKPVNTGMEIDPDWYDKTIHPLSTGYDIVMFSVPLKQWKGGKIRGRWTADSIQETQLGADEKGEYEYNGIKHEGGRWFNIARHELCHALYRIQGKLDNTHKWWDAGKLEMALEDLKDTKPVVLIERTKSTKNQTLGKLTANNAGATFICDTLELAWKNNASNISCIPTGTYEAKWTLSPRFMKFTYEILNVKNRTGIRIHSANYFNQLNGCIALGSGLQDLNNDGELDIINSRKTIDLFNSFMGNKSFTLIIK